MGIRVQNTLSTNRPSFAAANRKRKSVPILLAQCWFPGLDNSSAKIQTYFAKKYTESNFFHTALGNCCSLKLPKCWLQFKKNFFCHLLQFSAHFRSLLSCDGDACDQWMCLVTGSTCCRSVQFSSYAVNKPLAALHFLTIGNRSVPKIITNDRINFF